MMVVYLVTADMGREIVDAADDVDRALTKSMMEATNEPTTARKVVKRVP